MVWFGTPLPSGAMPDQWGPPEGRDHGSQQWSVWWNDLHLHPAVPRSRGVWSWSENNCLCLIIISIQLSKALILFFFHSSVDVLFLFPLLYQPILFQLPKPLFFTPHQWMCITFISSLLSPSSTHPSPQGFITGVGKGLLGTVAKPVAGLFDLASGTSAALRETMSRVSRLHPPPVRHRRCCIGSTGTLTCYSEIQARGQEYLLRLNDGDRDEK